MDPRFPQQIHESDIQLLPDPATAMLNRCTQALDLTRLIAHDPLTGAPYSRDPRNVARRGPGLLRGYRDQGHGILGPEAEFSSELGPLDLGRQRLPHIDSVEGAWNTGKDEDGGDLAYEPQYEAGLRGAADGHTGCRWRWSGT